jgi:uncharacterized protein (TIGR02996 family)
VEAPALEQTLREHPDDLATWLVYGDWLLERGDARGALIQLEQRRARARPAEREELQSEIDALEEQHRKQWDAGLPEGVTVQARRYGFPTKVAVEWTEDAPALIEQALRERFVTALRIAPSADDDGDDDDDVDEDDFDEHGNPKPLPPLEAGALATIDLSRLVELDLAYLNIGAPGAKALAASGSLGRGATLAALDLRYCNIGNRGLAALAACPRLGELRRLHLQRNGLTAAGVASLRRFGKLAELDLRYNKIGGAGAQALIEAPFIGSLARLQLHRADVSGAGAKKLARAPQLPPALRSYWRSV